jgi:hypothetical protein
VIDPIHQPVSVRARAGADIPLYVWMDEAASDRRLTSAKLIVGVPGSSADLVSPYGKSTRTVLKEENQVTSVALEELTPKSRSVVSLRVPDGTPPGDYPIFGYDEWPGPSVCGVPNDPNSTMRGQSLGQVGTLMVLK